MGQVENGGSRGWGKMMMGEDNGVDDREVIDRGSRG